MNFQDSKETVFVILKKRMLIRYFYSHIIVLRIRLCKDNISWNQWKPTHIIFCLKSIMQHCFHGHSRFEKNCLFVVPKERILR